MTEQTIAYRLGRYGKTNVQRQIPTLTDEDVQRIHAKYPEEFRRGLQKFGQRYATESEYDGVVEDIQSRSTKYTVHHAIYQDIAECYGDRTLKQGLRLITLPGKHWTFETGLITPGGPMAGKVSEIVGIEGCPELIDPVRRKARQLAREYPHTKFSVFGGRDLEMFTSPKGRTVLKPEAGVNVIWLDWMTNWSTPIERTLNNILTDISLFSRAWSEQAPGLLYLTLQIGMENKNSIKIFNNAWAAATEFQPVSSLLNPKRQTYTVRSCGLAAYIATFAKIRGIDCTPIRQIFYREEVTQEEQERARREGKQVMKAKMWLSGFKLFPSPEGAPTVQKPVSAEFWNMGRA